MISLQRWFKWSAIVVLTLTSVAKLLSATGDAVILDLPDPLFGLPRGQVLLVVACLELMVVGGLLSRMAARRKHLLLLWLSTSFLLYRIAIYSIAPGKPCACLGSLTEVLPFSEATVNGFLSCLVIYLLAGSAFLLRFARCDTQDTNDAGAALSGLVSR
jgi:hypothetical protein